MATYSFHEDGFIAVSMFGHRMVEHGHGHLLWFQRAGGIHRVFKEVRVEGRRRGIALGVDSINVRPPFSNEGLCLLGVIGRFGMGCHGFYL